MITSQAPDLAEQFRKLLAHLASWRQVLQTVKSVFILFICFLCIHLEFAYHSISWLVCLFSTHFGLPDTHAPQMTRNITIRAQGKPSERQRQGTNEKVAQRKVEVVEILNNFEGWWMMLAVDVVHCWIGCLYSWAWCRDVCMLVFVIANEKKEG